MNEARRGAAAHMEFERGPRGAGQTNGSRLAPIAMEIGVADVAAAPLVAVWGSSGTGESGRSGRPDVNVEEIPGDPQTSAVIGTTATRATRGRRRVARAASSREGEGLSSARRRRWSTRPSAPRADLTRAG